MDRDRRTPRHEIMAMLMDVVVISVVAVVRVNVLRGHEVDRKAMRRGKICLMPRELACPHRFRCRDTANRDNFLQRGQELPVIGKFRILVGTLRGCGDLLSKRPNPIVPGEVAFAVQQYHEREGLGLPRLPERWGFVQINRDGSLTRRGPGSRPTGRAAACHVPRSSVPIIRAR